MVFAAVTAALLPPRCGGCLEPGPPLCGACHQRIHARAALADLAWTRLADGVVAVAAFAYHGPLAAALKRAKAPGGHRGAHALAALLWAQLRVDPRTLPAPRTWVPSVPRQERSRAWNLPQVLAGPGALPLLARVGAPPDQTGLSARARRASPHGTFRARTWLAGPVVLIDDVRTTGATALAAAAALRQAGASRVMVVTLALAGQDALARTGLPASRGTAR